jgi:hypothetical protein
MSFAHGTTGELKLFLAVKLEEINSKCSSMDLPRPGLSTPSSALLCPAVSDLGHSVCAGLTESVPMNSLDIRRGVVLEVSFDISIPVPITAWKRRLTAEDR